MSCPHRRPSPGNPKRPARTLGLPPARARLQRRHSRENRAKRGGSPARTAREPIHKTQDPRNAAGSRTTRANQAIEPPVSSEEEAKKKTRRAARREAQERVTED